MHAASKISLPVSSVSSRVAPAAAGVGSACATTTPRQPQRGHRHRRARPERIDRASVGGHLNHSARKSGYLRYLRLILRLRRKAVEIAAEDFSRTCVARADLVERRRLLRRRHRSPSRAERTTSRCRRAAGPGRRRRAPAEDGAERQARVILDPAVRARRVEQHVGAEVGDHQRLAKQAGAEVRNDDRHGRIARARPRAGRADCRSGCRTGSAGRASCERRPTARRSARTPTVPGLAAATSKMRPHAIVAESRSDASPGTGRSPRMPPRIERGRRAGPPRPAASGRP